MPKNASFSLAYRLAARKLMEAGVAAIPGAAVEAFGNEILAHGGELLRAALLEIPPGNHWHCDRYETDDEIVLTVWGSNSGKDFTVDVRCPKG